MTTQTVEFAFPTGQTVTAKLFPEGSDTQTASVVATEQTNRLGMYQAAYTSVAAGRYTIHYFVAGICYGMDYVNLLSPTATYKVTPGVDLIDINGDQQAAANAALFWHGNPPESGTAQSGAAGTITLRAGANANDDFYKNGVVVLTGGTGAGQMRRIYNGAGVAYNGTTKVATISGDRNWIVNPDSTTTYIILGEITP